MLFLWILYWGMDMGVNSLRTVLGKFSWRGRSHVTAIKCSLYFVRSYRTSFWIVYIERVFTCTCKKSACHFCYIFSKFCMITLILSFKRYFGKLTNIIFNVFVQISYVFRPLITVSLRLPIQTSMLGILVVTLMASMHG